MLQVADAGKSEHVIVIRHEAHEAEWMAARELAHFLEQMTGAAYPIRTDQTAAQAKELILGETNRFARSDLPAAWHPTTLEGFAIHYPDPNQMVILGNSDRGTLYGVYDFLEQELGCRFLTPEVNHVPTRPDLAWPARSRVYDPPLEYRSLLTGEDTWFVRNRLNGRGQAVPMESLLGGTRFVGPRFVHTAGYLVPSDTYFEDHPEYYALVEGERRRTISGSRGGLCLTHPQVLTIATERVRGWIQAHQAGRLNHPESTLLVSITANDDERTGWCECSQCRAVNEEEGAESGALIRFINAVAETLGQDHPYVRFETLAYSRSLIPPRLTVPRDNVIIRFAPIDSDFGRVFDDPESDLNRITAENMVRWAQISDYLYVWDYHTSYHAYFKPFPNLRTLDHNLRWLIDQGVRGYFAQTSQTVGAAFEDLRNYMLARCLWRPQTEGRQVMEEFCTLYYGPAAGARVLAYIDRVHDFFLEQQQPLRAFDASRADGIRFSYPFLIQADDLLAEAEAVAENDVKKHRVAVMRLSLWYLLLEEAFAGRIGSESTLALPIDWHFRTDPDQVGQAQGWYRQSEFADWPMLRTDEFWTRQGYDYHGAAWYAVSFEVAAGAAGTFDTIHFGAIDGEHHTVYLNGVQVDERQVDVRMTWNQPFHVRLPEPLVAGRHVLVVRTRKEERAAGIWRPVTLSASMQAFPERIRTAGRRFIEVTRQIGVTHLSEFYGKRGTQLDHYYPRIEALLLSGSQGGGGGTDVRDVEDRRVIRQPMALLPNSKYSFTVTFDDQALQGACVVQAMDRHWTLLQAIRWNEVDEHLRSLQGASATLRVRSRVASKQGQGLAFRVGVAENTGREGNWKSFIRFETRVHLDDIASAGGGWQWHEVAIPADFQMREDRRYFAFIWPEHRPETEDRLYVDMFELVRGN